MTSDFLDTVDAAGGGRCACLCGRQITGESPSAFFASELCARRWQHRTDLAVVFERVAGELFAGVSTVVRGVVAAFRPIFDEVRRFAAVLEGTDPCPDAPAARALWLLRHRNTGPHPLLRAPTRVDPGGGLGGPLGQPPYRRVR